MAAEEKKTQALELAPKRVSLIESMAARFSMDPMKFAGTVVATCFPDGRASNEQLAAFLAVAHEYGLNPFTRELFAFPSKGGGIVPIVSVDGWVKLVVGNPDFGGMEFEPVYAMKDDGTPDKSAKLAGMTCRIWRKSLPEHPVEITEYYDECYRNTEPWNKMHRRMLRHKALKEAGRYAFGFAGITDEDEGRDIVNITAESEEMERSTATKQEALKEKIGKKREPKPLVDMPHEPEPSPAAQHAESTSPVMDDLDAPAGEPEPLVTEAQRQEFLNAVAKKHPPVNGKLPDEARAKIVERLKALGVAKLQELTVSQWREMMTWTETL